MKHLTIVLLAVSAILVSSCMSKMDMGNMTTDKNINYPAAFVVNGESSTISVIKLSDNTVSETLELMGTGNDMIMYPHHISTHANHLSIGVPGMDFSAGHAVTGTMPGKLLIIDAVTGAIFKNINLPLMNHNTIYSPNGTEIWVPQMDMKGKVLVYDATSFNLKNTINVGMMPAELTFSGDGTKAYVANGDDDNVSIINVTSKAVVATIGVGDNPVGAWAQCH